MLRTDHLALVHDLVRRPTFGIAPYVVCRMTTRLRSADYDIFRAKVARADQPPACRACVNVGAQRVLRPSSNCSEALEHAPGHARTLLSRHFTGHVSPTSVHADSRVGSFAQRVSYKACAAEPTSFVYTINSVHTLEVPRVSLTTYTIPPSNPIRPHPISPDGQQSARPQPPQCRPARL